MWLSSGVAASLLMFHFLTANQPLNQPLNQPTNTPVALVTQPAVQIVQKTTETKVTAPVLTEEDEEFSETNVPTLDIGEEYLTLAGI
jgi:hypothetical protein